ncbi:pre-16S rRNA-processing nuclease YqgF [Anabaena sp. FACHB-1237]|uniref:pre-16S rRNA-processing nuclease YqgF n=1 Tax=Anabaena sp. FACHB-1237 TaxID=2692769 RepID=UPI00167FF568|nr:pre-16S rRNA-processing nuclease YqgF [Anabaena sp. FACHB-1237]MBD2137129.1 pre-16S rRNA-processing nuclease YqgF [Anabaena sp. FACHB-1237]
MKNTEMIILGFDPGKDKCGLAVMGTDQTLYDHQVVLAEEAIVSIDKWCEKFGVDLLVMGDQTTSKKWRKKLDQELNKAMKIVLVDERNSTLEARDRYWQMYPPQGIKKLIPQGMRQPPRPIDDIVAILLIERYLKLKLQVS